MNSKIMFYLLCGLAKRSFVPMRVRIALYKWGGIKISDHVVICSGADFRSANIELGRSTLINKNCHLYASEDTSNLNGRIKIGNNVRLGFDVQITTSTHKIGTADKRCGENIEMPVTIEDGCWIGMGVKILPGVTIGAGCVIGAGSVVVKDCEPNGLYVGCPAHKIKTLG